ncbi:hypothetical protein BZA77DRAFT_359569 [Pyronema omphalodes]|nr:hypothetical protein BZA77DRAFT_359569 [Pyronema omphalodes]
MLPLLRTIPRTRTLRSPSIQQKRNAGHAIHDPERRLWSENPSKTWMLAITLGGGLTYGLSMGLRWADNWKTGKE